MASTAIGIRDFARDCRAVGRRDLSRRMQRRLYTVAKPVKVAVQQRARAIPAASGYHTGLREALARATRISISPASTRVAVVRLMVDGKRMPGNQSSLPAYMEGSDGFRGMHWRHPVFGPHTSSTWVAQASHPFVRRSCTSTVPAIERAMGAALDEAIAELKG
jgi:hypothetical protein